MITGRTRQPVVAAVDVGGTSIKSGLVTADGQLVESWTRPVAGTTPGPRLVDLSLDAVEQCVRAGRTRADLDLRAVGLAVPGVVDEAAGVGRYSMIMGWRQVPFGQLLQRFSLPIAFSHDVSAGAFAEARMGAAAGHQDWLFLALGTGLGSTFVLNGRPYRGSGGTGGELSHVRARSDGPLCRCGNHGCLEMIASAPAILAEYQRRRGATSTATTTKEVAAAVAAGDPIAREVWMLAIEALADVLAGYIESMNPSIIVVGGGLAQAGALLLEPLAAQVADRVTFADIPPISAARFGDRAALIGVGRAAHDCANQDPAEQIGGAVYVPFSGSLASDRSAGPGPVAVDRSTRNGAISARPVRTG